MSNSHNPDHSLGINPFDMDWYDTPPGGKHPVHQEIPDFFQILQEGDGDDLSRLTIRLSDYVHNAFIIPNEEGDFDKFSFRGRNHLIWMYDTPARNILLKCARQVEKCCGINTYIECISGPKEAQNVLVGEKIGSWDEATNGIVWGTVTWKSGIVNKPCVEIETRSGRCLVVGEEHPIRMFGRWVLARDVKAGDYVAAVGEIKAPSDQFGEEQVFQAILAAAALAGYVHTSGQNKIQVTVPFPSILGLLKEVLENQNAPYLISRRTPDSSPMVTIGGDKGHSLAGWMVKIRKAEVVPGFVFESREAAWAFLKVYWALKGSVYVRGKTFETLTLTESKMRAKSLHSLHLRVGIFTVQKRVVPSYYKEKGAAPKVHHGLRVAGEGRATFYEMICEEQRSKVNGAHTEDMIQGYQQLPVEFTRAVLDLQKQRTGAKKGLEGRGYAWRKIQPRRDHRLSRRRAKDLLDHLGRDAVYDSARVQALRTMLEPGVMWDEVVAVRVKGELPCVDFTVEGTHTFLAEGLVTHNSTYLGNVALALSALIPGYKTLYVSPTNTQTRTFSSDRLKNPLETSPILKTFVQGGVQQNVLTKTFVNFSQIILRSAYLSADRCRGIAAYMLLLDELQDLLADHIPVILPCTSHAPDKYRRHVFSGTPKSFDNNIEFYWSGYNRSRPMSTMGEWMIPCDTCGGGDYRYWQCLGEENIQKKGLSCRKCGTLINSQHPSAAWVHQQADGMFEGYRVSQLMVPWRPWPSILDDYATFPRAKFYNEVLGLSMDTYDRPLSMAEVRACCDERLTLATATRFKKPRWSEMIFAGIDWGLGTLSYTVMTLATYIGGVFTVFWMKRFTGTLLDVQEQIHYVLEVLKEYNVEVVGTDFGFGLQNNDLLLRKFGTERVAVFQHMGKVKKKVEYDAKLFPPRFKVFRSMVMADLINAVKRKAIRFMRWEDMRDPFAQDFCNIVAEHNDRQSMMIYNHRPDRPDDSFHSFLYAFLASTLRIPRPDILRPMHDRHKQGPVMSLTGTINQG
jgi:hypothetical protein